MCDPMILFTIATSLGQCMRYMAIAFVADEAKTIPDKRDDNHGQITYSD